MSHKNTVRKSRAGSGLNLLKGCTLMLVMTLMVMGCDSIVDQQTEADSGIATSDISGVLSVDTPPVTCIVPSDPAYNMVKAETTVEWGNKKKPSSKTVDIEYYNTLTHFILRVKSTRAIANVLMDDESIKDFDGTVAADDWQEFTFDLDEGGTQSFSLKVAGSGPPAYFEVNYTLLGECVTGCPFTYNDVISVTGRIWMDRNLGACRVAESSTDAEAYGDLFQWGRAADGHQIINRFLGDGKITSGTRNEQSNSDQPGHPDFIIGSTDWLVTQDNTLWQGVNGTNNPCPIGYRLPTADEWQDEIDSWSPKNALGAIESPLKLPVAGYRRNSSGSLGNVGSFGYYWSGTVGGTFSQYLYFSSSNAVMLSSYRAFGFSVRCLKEDTSD